MDSTGDACVYAFSFLHHKLLFLPMHDLSCAKGGAPLISARFPAFALPHLCAFLPFLPFVRASPACELSPPSRTSTFGCTAESSNVTVITSHFSETGQEGEVETVSQENMPRR